MLPVTAAALLESIDAPRGGRRELQRRCIEGLTATDAGPQLVEQGLMLATALAPGDRLRRGGRRSPRRRSRAGARSASSPSSAGWTPAELDRLLDPAAMTEPGLGGGPAGG